MSDKYKNISLAIRHQNLLSIINKESLKKLSLKLFAKSPVGQWVIISDLPSISAILGYLTLPTCLLTNSQSTGPYQSTDPFPVN